VWVNWSAVINNITFQWNVHSVPVEGLITSSGKAALLEREVSNEWVTLVSPAVFTKPD
jgi:hypothetical protein